MEANFRVIEEFSQSFEKYRDIYDAGSSSSKTKWDVAVFSASKPNQQAFRSKIMQVREWTTKLTSMETLAFKGNYKVTSHNLQNNLVEVVNGVTNDIKGLLLKNFVSRCI